MPWRRSSPSPPCGQTEKSDGRREQRKGGALAAVWASAGLPSARGWMESAEQGETGEQRKVGEGEREGRKGVGAEEKQR